MNKTPKIAKTTRTVENVTMKPNIVKNGFLTK